MLNNEIYPQIYSEHKSSLNHVDIINPQLYIVFSGVPGSGKSTLSKELEERYKGLRWEGEVIRQLAFAKKIAQNNSEAEKVKDNYLWWFINNYPCKNRLFILDRSIDRIHPTLLGLFDGREENYFIIFLDISREAAAKELRRRTAPDEEKRGNYLEKWFGENKLARKEVEGDIAIRRGTSLNNLYSKLDKLLDYSL